MVIYSYTARFQVAVRLGGGLHKSRSVRINNIVVVPPKGSSIGVP